MHPLDKYRNAKLITWHKSVHNRHDNAWGNISARKGKPHGIKQQASKRASKKVRKRLNLQTNQTESN